MRTGPIEDGELSALFSGLADQGRIGVAVSGGPDSTALIHLLDRWSRARGGRPALTVLTVDHGLRPGSAEEAGRVAALAASLRRPFRRLDWAHPEGPPASDIQAAAREARFRLLAGAAHEEGLEAVVLAHTLDDKAETLLIRLSRGSGLAGLAAMPAERVVHGVRFLRPLLAVPKARLVATLEAAGIGWIEDPSNIDADRFLRAKLRALSPALAEVGLTAERLAATADRLARASEAVETLVDALSAGAMSDHGGVISIDRPAMTAAPEEVALRLLARACGRVRPSPHPPRAGALEAVLDMLHGGAAPRRSTGGGVVLDPVRDRLWIYAEAGRRGFPTLVVNRPGTHVWDGRFELVVNAPLAAPLVVAAASGPERRADLPKRAASSLPVVRREGGGEAGPAGEDVILRPVTQV